MAPTTKMRQSDFFAEVSGITGTWATSGKPSLSGQAAKVRDGGAPRSESLPGPGEWSDITLSRPFDLARDFASYRQLVGMYAKPVTVTIFGKTNDGVISDKFTVTGTVMGVAGPDGDSQSNNGTTLEVTVAVDDVV